MKKNQVLFTNILIVTLIFTGCKYATPTGNELLTIPTTTLTTTTPTTSPSIISDIIESKYIKILPDDAQNRMNKDVIILDVRSQEEYDEGHIKGAIVLPDYEIKEKAETKFTDKSQTILVYCRSGRRSEQVARELIDMGYEHVYDFGGITEWTGEIVGNWLYPSYYNYFGSPLPPDIVTPINFLTTQKISEQLPEFTFRLTGSKVKSYWLTDNNTKYYIGSDQNEIDSITITDKSGVLIQEIVNLKTANPASEAEMYGLSFDDWNFDGYLDIALWSYPGGSMRNDPHYYWLWDNNIGQFVENLELNEISDYNTISINVEANQLECYKSLGNLGNLVQHYEYINNSYVLVYSLKVEYLLSPDEKDKNIRHITTEELIDGKMIITETYENIDE